MFPGLNENHRRVLTATLTHLDKLLTDAEHAMTVSSSPFARIASDLTSAERRVMEDHLARARAQLADAARALGLALPPPRVQAVAAVQTDLLFAEVAIEDVSPPRLRGYGDLDQDAAILIERVESDLIRTLQRARSFLARRASGDLAGRLERLERAPFDLRILRTLEGVVARQGLVAFRPAIEALLERAEARTFEIAFFGRVGSGKSSLLNRVLGTSVLPVGATPVTAVPTRLVWGDPPVAIIQHADRPPDEVAVDRLPEFVSEAGNPENKKCVVHAVVRLPSLALRTGAAFVDTPGVGSLAASGARETFAYLPRCDLGVLLVAASGAIEREDVEVVRLLHESGIPATIVVSKTDLLSDADRIRMRDYVMVEMAKSVGVDVTVSLVSTVGASVELAATWFDQELSPLLARVKALSEASARRKLAALREGVVATLRAALDARMGTAQDSARQREDIERRALEAEAAMAEAHRRCEQVAGEVGSLADVILARAAHEMTQSAVQGGEPDPAAVLQRVLDASSEQVRSQLREALLAARDALGGRLKEMGAELSWPSPPQALVLDLLSLPALIRQPALSDLRLRQPRWLGRFPSLLERRLLNALHEQCKSSLDGALRSWSSALRAWSGRAIARLVGQYGLEAEPMRAYLRRLAPGPTQDGTAEGALADLCSIDAATADSPSSAIDGDGGA
jgi:GTP-binding protein EngB required for normal cell division